MSRLIKAAGGADVREPRWAVAAQPPPPGVQEFQPRRVGEPEPPEGDARPAGRSQPARKPEAAKADPPEALRQAELERVRRDAFQQGYEQAAQEARRDVQQVQAKASEQLQAAVQSFGRTVHELNTLRPKLRREVEQDLVRLAFEIAKRVVHREVTLDPATVLGIVRACLDQFDAAEWRRILVNPQDYELVEEFFRGHPAPHLEIVPDASIGRGGAVFETAQGRLDARIETQLQEIELGLADD